MTVDQAEALFDTWIGQARRGLRRKPARLREVAQGLRFAFYGRTSTLDYQDRWSSHGWQREAAESLIDGRGEIVATFFDVGVSRSEDLTARPQMAALIRAISDPMRGFDAIVVGEFERAFAGDQLQDLLPLLEAYGVRLWLPETRGPVEPSNPAHQALMLLLGSQSQREVLRSRFRTLAAMRTQTADQGRFLGGRPPYGYRLVDAGPHPNRAHARWGRRLQKLAPDPATAPHVRWIFAQRLAGTSVAAIARGLNERGVLCPSSADWERNRHRSGEAWLLPTVAAILENPRYTGRQVWDRRNSPQAWTISEQRAHPALVSDEDFVIAQAIRAARPTGDGSTRVYLLSGLLRCALCLRRMDAHWVNNRPGYRCRHGHTSSKKLAPEDPKFLYVREDKLLAEIFGEASPEPLIAVLRSQDMAIVCDRESCRIKTKEPVPENGLLMG